MKLFPIQTQRGAAPHPLAIPWDVAELAYSVYAGRFGRCQSLETLASRGGFGPGEMDELLPDWRQRCDRIVALESQLATARCELAEERARVGRLIDFAYATAVRSGMLGRFYESCGGDDVYHITGKGTVHYPNKRAAVLALAGEGKGGGA